MNRAVCSPTPSAWDLRTRNTILFGQGYTVNALQLNNVVATIANKGVKQQQSIIKSTTDANGKTTAAPRRAKPPRVVDEKVASDMMNAMESVAEGYNKFVKVDGYRMAAKSGTAEVQRPGWHALVHYLRLFRGDSRGQPALCGHRGDEGSEWCVRRSDGRPCFRTDL